MANPKHSLSRVDLRPAAGAEPAVPAWAKDDYVLSRWIKEERARRRRFLADQVLEHREPRIHYRPQNTIGDRIFGPIRNAFKPLDVATGGRLFRGWLHTKKYLVLLVIPAWTAHYFVKYHVATKPHGIVTEKSAVFPAKTDHAGHHH
ncbi:NADH dehydrogenase [ubiquinone] 1 beta subcomplex subunit 6-like [Apostichopus japonicus]|uniref:NADH dehydrogenase [ubiquinone] 1 beta subcomplex subunit 6-like n=1 Tax=Stichopus japonicus TaxID=307972 RepID=UPI003AB85D16